MRLLFVCLGNICRSPTAEGVMRSLVREAGLRRSDRARLGRHRRAGTWAAAGRARERGGGEPRGSRLEGRARQVRREDFDDFDLLLAMDPSNMRELRQLAPGVTEREKVKLLREFDPKSAGVENLDVPDPYYGGEDGFDKVFELVHAACEGLLVKVETEIAADAA